jgi:glycosyltransferase involved in cell wall biosynthesis
MLKNQVISMNDILSHSVDLFLFMQSVPIQINWPAGVVRYLPKNLTSVANNLMEWAVNSQAEYGLFWSDQLPLPTQACLQALIDHKLDFAHAGLDVGLGELWPSLAMVKQDWSMINAPKDRSSSSWRVSLQACLVRRDLLIDLHGLDPVFTSLEAAGLDLGLRALSLGAIIDYRPELMQGLKPKPAAETPLQDLYAFLYRHYGLRWTQYLVARRSLSTLRFTRELRAMQNAQSVCERHPRSPGVPVNYHITEPELDQLARAQVTVIIPTLGRYEYVLGALNSIRKQTIRPAQVIVVDQNPIDQRQPQVYDGYKDLNLQVIWQDERGQSLARNTGLAAARSQYVFLFDDDSIAQPDLIEQHLIPLMSGYVDVSTGVAIPPPPEEYILPPNCRYPRLAQTFDTGNAMLSLDLARQMGGLDRNYDFGPGTDADFGTRLYLAGYRILHNPKAIRIHFKAPSGGLRIHGAYKYNTDAGLLAPFPPVTRSYYALRYLNTQQRREVAFLTFMLSKFPKKIRSSGSSPTLWLLLLLRFSIGFIILPIKQRKSLSKARILLMQGPRIEHNSNQTI